MNTFPWGFVKPYTAFGNFNNSTIQGMWVLRCIDMVNGNTGVLQGWGMRINNAVGIAKNNNNIPERFMLYQNYPNPFNPTTLIGFDIPKDANVTVRIYDLIGREVQTVVNEFKKAGSYKFNFDASLLSSGSYFYEINAGDFRDTKKMVLIK